MTQRVINNHDLKGKYSYVHVGTIVSMHINDILIRQSQTRQIHIIKNVFFGQSKERFVTYIILSKFHWCLLFFLEALFVTD